MYGETFGMNDVNKLIYALQYARQSVTWLIKKYPNDPEITAHQIHLRKINQALKGWEN